MSKRYVDESWRTLSERREQINIRMSAAYSCLGRNLSRIDKQTPFGVEMGFVHIKNAYVRMYDYILDKHCT